MAHSHPAYATAREEVAAKLRWVTPEFRVKDLMEQLADETIRGAQLWLVADNSDPFHPHTIAVHATGDDARMHVEQLLHASVPGGAPEIHWMVPDGGGFAVPIVGGHASDAFLIRPVKAGVVIRYE